jgi:hypothetical protein
LTDGQFVSSLGVIRKHSLIPNQLIDQHVFCACLHVYK